MGMLGEIEGLVDTTEGTVEVAQEGIDRSGLWQPGAGFAAAGDRALMLGTYNLDGAVALQPGYRSGRRRERRAGGRRHLLDGERRLAQAHELRLTVGHGLNCSGEGHLVLRAAPYPVGGALATVVGVVDLHPAIELARVLALPHDLHELVFHEPGRLVTNAQVALAFVRSDVVLGSGQQVHGQEPARQRQRGRLEDGVADGAALAPAGGALEVQPAFAPKRATVATPARRAAKALGRVPSNSCIVAELLYVPLDLRQCSADSSSHLASMENRFTGTGGGLWR